MVITVTKHTTAEELEKGLKKFQKSNKKGLRRFYGKLKGTFGDGIEYQKAVRN